MTWQELIRSSWTAATGFLFCHGLGVSTVVLPLLALAAGFGAQTVGLLVAVSAAAQILARIGLTRLLHRLPERQLVIASAALLCLSGAAVLASESLAAFLAAHLLQGVARACFWVGLQVHVVRSTDDPLRPLVVVDLVSGVGMVTGPATIGLLGGSLTAALVAGVGSTAAAGLTTLGLDRLSAPPPPEPSTRAGVWRRPGLAAALFAATSAGTWRGLLNSYVPVVLAAAGHPDATVGLLVGLGSGASVAGSMTAGSARGRRLRPVYAAAAVVTGAGLVAVAAWPGQPAVALALLAASGAGAGIMQTLSPALAARAVPPADRGPVVATVGTYRAGALLCAPLGIVVLLAAVPLGPAMAAVAATAALPALTRWPRPSRPPPPGGSG